MPIVLNQIKLPIEENESSLSMHAARALAVPAKAILGLRVVRISLDARKNLPFPCRTSIMVSVTGRSVLLLPDCMAMNHMCNTAI